MRKLYVAGASLFAVLIMGSFVAQAFALETVWLEGNVKPLEWLLVLSEGELKLEDTNPEKLKVPTAFLCSILYEGWIASHLVNSVLTYNPKNDEITKITNLAGTSNVVNCAFTAHGLCEESSSPTGEAVNLPWLTELVLVGGQFLDLILSENASGIGWKSSCLILGMKKENICTVPGTAAKPWETEIDNTTEGDVLSLFSKAIQLENPLCSLSGEETGIVEGSILIFAESGESLQVSEG